jgi:hypothetical protein
MLLDKGQYPKDVFGCLKDSHVEGLLAVLLKK